MNSLKPCPFCGSEPKIEVLGGPQSNHRTIQCTKCKCDLHWQITEDLAVAAWNKRVPTEQQVSRAFDMIAKCNTVTICTLGEMESIVNRALSGEFDS